MFRAWTAEQDGLTCFPSGSGFLRLVDKTADVFADTICHRNVEARLGWDIEELPACVGRTRLGAVDLDLAGACDDLHALRFVCAEVVMARVNQTERFLAAIRKANAVADDLAVKIDIGFGDGGDV